MTKKDHKLIAMVLRDMRPEDRPPKVEMWREIRFLISERLSHDNIKFDPQKFIAETEK